MGTFGRAGGRGRECGLVVHVLRWLLALPHASNCRRRRSGTGAAPLREMRFPKKLTNQEHKLLESKPLKNHSPSNINGHSNGLKTWEAI